MDKQKITLKLIDGNLKEYSGSLSLFDDFISIDDRRVHQRISLDAMDIQGKSAYAKVVRILNMSVNGILLETDRRPRVGDACILKIKGKGNIVNVNSVVMWYLLDRRTTTRRGDLISIYKVGLKFVNMSREKMEEIVAFIEHHKHNFDKYRDVFALSGLRLHMRFQIETPEKAILICRQNYRVKNISPGGMLIESENALEIGKKLHLQISRSNIKSMRVVGRVVSCMAIDENDHAHYNIVIEFLGMIETDWEKFKNVICSLENIGLIAI